MRSLLRRSGPLGLSRPAYDVPILSRIGPQPLVAYSAARRLRGGYAGPLVRVRRSTDSAELDIGTNADGTLDTAALLAHIGANSGYVRTLYDQSGNGTNAVQATTANQPRIVNAGVIDTYGGRPCVRSAPTGTEAHRLDASVTINGTTCSVIAVGSMESNCTAVGRLLSVSKVGVTDYDRTTAFTVSRNGGTVLQAWPAGSGTASVTFGSLFVMSRVFDGTDDRSRFNGTFFTSSPAAHTANFDVNVVKLCSWNAVAGDTWGGGIGDTMVFSSAISDYDRQQIERDFGRFYGVVVQ